jgi:hypothetical protein
MPNPWRRYANWIHLAQNVIQRQTFVKTPMNLEYSKREFSDQQNSYHFFMKQPGPWIYMWLLIKSDYLGEGAWSSI